MASDDAPAAITLAAHDDGAFVELRLRRPPRNVLDGAALDTLAALAADLAGPAHAAVRAILLTADGPSFSVGASVPEHARAHAAAMLGRFHRAIRALVACDLPIIAAVRGHCLGGGLELALCATRIVAHPDAQLGQPEILLGALAPVASVLLPRLVGQARAEALLVSGARVDAAAAHALGLVAAIADEPEAAAAAWIRANLAPLSARSLRLATRAARRALVRDLDTLLPELERLYAEELSPTHDAEEGVRAFLEKRAPRWEHR
ncbi:MAG: enoyl-CoA hydratase/isomerase family protein [Kofleriaceae bacterium]|nr:enoyl-CoA hydratase/isomerase family protein [Kofleriaceae bacterium]MCL4222956.1 enoyl-CoA hydratase/isomerase family protein [Myxococcales bacterium]